MKRALYSLVALSGLGLFSAAPARADDCNPTQVVVQSPAVVQTPVVVPSYYPVQTVVPVRTYLPTIRYSSGYRYYQGHYGSHNGWHNNVRHRYHR